MPQYNNSAGRILAVLERFPTKKRPNKGISRKQLADAMGMADSWSAILLAIDDLQSEYRVLVNDLEQFRDNTHKHELYSKNLGDIEQSISSFKLDLPGNSAQVEVSEASRTALTFIAADLPQDDLPTESDLNRIRELVNELQSEVESSTELARSVKDWLLDLVRIIRDSLDRYAIRGSRGMRRQFSTLLGELMQNWDTLQKVKEKRPTVWQKFTASIDLMHKLASLAEKCVPAVTFTQKYLPLIKGVLLPSPSDDPTDVDP